MSIEERLMFIYNHEPIWRLRGSSLLDFDPFGSTYEDFYEIVWCTDKETAIKLTIERWQQKWKEIIKEAEAMTFFPKVKIEETRSGWRRISF